MRHFLKKFAYIFRMLLIIHLCTVQKKTAFAFTPRKQVDKNANMRNCVSYKQRLAFKHFGGKSVSDTNVFHMNLDRP